MRSVKIILIFIFALSLTQEFIYAQPQIPLEKIPSDIKPQLRKQIEKLYSQNPLERKRAAAGIGEYGKEAEPAIPFLIELLGDSSPCPEPGVIYNHIPLVYETVTWVIVNIGQSAVKPLLNALNSSDPLVRGNSAYCLGRIGDKRAVEALLKMLNDSDSMAKWHAIRALGELKDKRATEPLLKMLSDAPSRAEIIYVLGQIKDASAVDTLSYYLSDKNKEVRIAAIRALGDIGHKSASPYLINLLSDGDAAIVDLAIHSLGETGGPNTVEVLAPIANSGQKEQAYRAINALKEIGNVKAIEALIALLDSKDATVRNNASWALHSIRGAGISFGQDPAKWKDWLISNKERFKK